MHQDQVEQIHLQTSVVSKSVPTLVQTFSDLWRFLQDDEPVELVRNRVIFRLILALHVVQAQHHGIIVQMKIDHCA